ncbi:hypothetical protein F4813DRAFT_384552 [Daldinia decipiens]|uniref:uncharacterized protein n=1 Tax=Daldinia decipiens TaxID=326647 RepID=UPI0020C25258|nr:uncharacterized protein F4813DRAFT_384552 [Daldinia decipiens]KAI1662977.1 hypothetical protein F4813DRAFT_384552 [Daldinia decipiens]
MLPAAVPDARIYTYDWNAKVFDNAPVQTLLGHADNLLSLVAAEHGTSGRPILFIASCFGGLVLAEAICRAAQEGNEYRQMLRSTIGIVFLATPFSGTNAADSTSWLVIVKGIMGKNLSLPSGKPGSGKTTLVKYLIDNPLTKEALIIWSKGANDPMILSHFFWKAGSEKLQRNIKGCICSILHQAVRPETIPLSSILTTYKFVSTKQSVTDWLLEELKDKPSWHFQISTGFGLDIVCLLVGKAEGVFLWLRLASDSLVRGLKNNDSEKILYQRLKELPNDLYRLYTDMWIRMNEDIKLYRESTARYFNLAIALQRKDKYYTPRLLRLMAVMNDRVQYIFVNERNTMDATSLKQECDKTIYEVQHRCIGLLEIVSTRHEIEVIMQDPTYKPLDPHWQMEVQFLHRTAYDFLTDTEEGRQILAHDSSSQHMSIVSNNKGRFSHEET